MAVAEACSPNHLITHLHPCARVALLLRWCGAPHICQRRSACAPMQMPRQSSWWRRSCWSSGGFSGRRLLMQRGRRCLVCMLPGRMRGRVSDLMCAVTDMGDLSCCSPRPACLGWLHQCNCPATRSFACLCSRRTPGAAGRHRAGRGLVGRGAARRRSKACNCSTGALVTPLCLAVPDACPDPHADVSAPP